ncbi:MAG: halocyanin domain-containing protein [Haloarcula sp.]
MYDRRSVLAGTFGTLAALAGCQSPGTAIETPTEGDSGGKSTGTAAQSSEIDYGGWFADTSNFDGTDDKRGESSVSISVGSEGNGGSFGFSPPAIHVDPGTTVTWEWTGNGGAHNVVAEDGSFNSGEPVSAADATFEQTLDGEGIHKYFCKPHRSLGMRGAVVVGDPAAGGDGGSGGQSYGFGAATFDAYWYSLYNMSTNIAMSGNGVLFPHSKDQRETFKKRQQAIANGADVDRPPINNPNLNMAPFTEGDPKFTQKPVFEDDSGRPNADTLQWDSSSSSGVVSPSSLAWTHLKGVTWAKNFQNHFDLLPGEIAPKFRAQILSTLAQLGVKVALVDGKLRKNEENMLLVSGFKPSDGAVVDGTPRPTHQAAMLWFMSDLTSLAQGGWFGYENPKPLIPAKNIQKLTDGVGKTTMNAFGPQKIMEASSTRGVGEMLGAVGWYGTHAGSDKLAGMAADYANNLASVVESNLAGNGKVENGTENQAATQGSVAQGLLWASQVDGADHTGTASDVVGYLVDELWDGDAKTFASGTDDATYRISARDAGDITGGLNAADAVLDRTDVRPLFAEFFNATFNRGRLQRAQRPPSVNQSNPDEPPVPPKAGGEFGQAAVYNAEVAYDTGADEWSVTDDRFDTEQALYLANQDIWVGNWGGDFFEGRGVPGTNDEP